MLGREQPYFRLLILSLKIDLSYFSYICDEYAQLIFCGCLPGIMENDVTCHGKVMEFYYHISVGTLCVLLGHTIMHVTQWCYVLLSNVACGASSMIRFPPFQAAEP